jgi:hypothetical protein
MCGRSGSENPVRKNKITWSKSKKERMKSYESLIKEYFDSIDKQLKNCNNK